LAILKINNKRITLLEIINNKLFIDNIKVKKGDIIFYRCNSCSHTEEITFRSHSNFIKTKFFNNKVICSKCLRKKTNLEKYGVENLSQSKTIQDKIKSNSLEKYGTTHFLSSKEVRDKIDSTNEERYGTKNILQSNEIKQKSKETMIKNYGVEYSLQSEDIKKKFNKSMVIKYGTPYAMHSFQIREKRRTSMQSNIEGKIFSFVHITPLFKKEDFIGINKFYKWKCNNCHTTFEDHLDYGHIPRCPHCNPKRVKVNRKKQEVVKWLQLVLNIKNIVIDSDILKPFDLGIYLPDQHIGIEVLSLYWDSESQGKDSDYQLNKASAATQAGIQLISTFEDEWTMKQKIIKSIIKQKLGLYGNTIQASDCYIIELTNKDGKLFYEKNYIQGHVNTQINYGLMHEREGLVSCLGMSKPRFNQNHQWEVVRFSNRNGINVMNSFAHLIKNFKEKHSGSIIAYGDCRYFDSNLYGYNGFQQIGHSEPNYFYTNYIDRNNRLQFQKAKLKRKLKYFDEELTEWQNMQMNGWDRIWDCGSNVFVLTE